MTRQQDVGFETESTSTSDDESTEHSSRRASGSANGPDPAREHSIQYHVAHAIPGRIRLKIVDYRQVFSSASNRILALAHIHGVQAVSYNKWCGSVLIEYNPSICSEASILTSLDSITYEVGETRTQQAAAGEPGPRKNAVTVLPAVRSSLRIIERSMPPLLQLVVGTAALAATLFKWPVVLTRVLIGASVTPIITRALRTGIEEKKAGLDTLDGTAALLLISTGKLLEATFMMSLIGLGEFIREKTAQRCEKMVTDLLGLSGRSAWLIRGDKRICVPADQVVPGDTVVVYPGDMVPVDGTVLKGEAAIDQSAMTGESIPVEVQIGSTVLASTVVVEGKVYVRCDASGSQTKAGQVLQCVASAPIHETKIQNYASSLADKLIVPIFIASAVSFAHTRDLARLMSMLILDFCTGLRIASPTAVLSSMHRAGSKGILVKSGATLERMASINAIVFDKTGTLTSGEPKVEEIARFNGFTEDEILALAASVEMRLHHPAARAIVKAAQARNLTIPERDESEFRRSLGVKATVGNHVVTVGSKNMMLSEGIVIDATREHELRATKLGESIAFVAINGKVAGLIRYSDRLRPEVEKAMKELKKLGVKKLVMATGDTEEAAQKIALRCGITDVMSRAFPEDKAALVQRLKAQGYNVAVIGDGINDSPALAYADVAISLHGATDAAQHSADIVLTDDNLIRLPESIRISRSCMSLIKQNLAMAVIPNGTGFAMAAYGLIGPAAATVLNNGAAIAAAINSMRPLYSRSWSAIETKDKKLAGAAN